MHPKRAYYMVKLIKYKSPLARSRDKSRLDRSSMRAAAKAREDEGQSTSLYYYCWLRLRWEMDGSYDCWTDVSDVGD